MAVLVSAPPDPPRVADAMQTSGVIGDYHEDANRLARKAWRALKRGTGMHLTAEEVQALHQIEQDGDWWQSFNPKGQAA